MVKKAGLSSKKKMVKATPEELEGLKKDLEAKEVEKIKKPPMAPPMAPPLEEEVKAEETKAQEEEKLVPEDNSFLALDLPPQPKFVPPLSIPSSFKEGLDSNQGAIAWWRDFEARLGSLTLEARSLLASFKEFPPSVKIIYKEKIAETEKFLSEIYNPVFNQYIAAIAPLLDAVGIIESGRWGRGKAGFAAILDSFVCCKKASNWPWPIVLEEAPGLAAQLGSVIVDVGKRYRVKFSEVGDEASDAKIRKAAETLKMTILKIYGQLLHDERQGKEKRREELKATATTSLASLMGKPAFVSSGSFWVDYREPGKGSTTVLFEFDSQNNSFFAVNAVGDEPIEALIREASEKRVFVPLNKTFVSDYTSPFHESTAKAQLIGLMHKMLYDSVRREKAAMERAREKEEMRAKASISEEELKAGKPGTAFVDLGTWIVSPRDRECWGRDKINDLFLLVKRGDGGELVAERLPTHVFKMVDGTARQSGVSRGVLQDLILGYVARGRKIPKFLK